MSEPWKPRRHDHFVEPLFGGLRHEPREDRGARALWIAAAIVFASLVARVVTLLH